MADQQRTIGKYQVQGMLKQGGMGVLYLGYDPELERQVAIKVIRTDSGLDQLRERFVREAKAVARLRHPNIVTIFEFGTHGDLQYIVMEFIPGQNLAEFIQRNAAAPLSEKLRLADSACAGLAFAHRGNIVHRDVKPANLMVDEDGTLKILDFGIARFAGPGLTGTGDIIGTLNYMSPEQMMGTRVDHRTDIFAMGAVLYELVTGVRAFPGDRLDGVMAKVLHADPIPIHTLRPDVDPQLDSIVTRALAKNPDDRYADLALLQIDLADVRERAGRAGRATTVRSAARTLPETLADAPTTASFAVYATTTVPVRVGPPVTRSRWVGLTAGAVLVGTLMSVSFKPLPVQAARSDAVTLAAAPMSRFVEAAAPIAPSRSGSSAIERRSSRREPEPLAPIAKPPAPVAVRLSRERAEEDQRDVPASVRVPPIESLSRSNREYPALTRGSAPAEVARVAVETEPDAIAPPPVAPKVDDRSAEHLIRRSLDEYLAAISSLNPEQVAKVRQLDSLGTETVRRWLSGMRRLNVELRSEPVIQIRQVSARAQCMLRYRIQPSVGGVVNTDVQTTFDLTRVGDRWLIDRITP